MHAATACDIDGTIHNNMCFQSPMPLVHFLQCHLPSSSLLLLLLLILLLLLLLLLLLYVSVEDEINEAYSNEMIMPPVRTPPMPNVVNAPTR